MNQPSDDFLMLLRREPDQAFARRLNQRLNTLPQKRHWTLPVLKTAAAAGMVLAILMMVSPEVRAQIAQRIESLFYGPVELIVVTQKLGPSSSEMRVSPIPNAIVERISPEAAQSELAHTTPRWHPERFTAEELVTIIRWNADEVALGYSWTNEAGETGITLNMLNVDMPRFVIGAGANSREIEINGQTGTIYRGSYDYLAWVAEGYLNVVWVTDGITYHLGSGTLSEEELVRMAESFQ